MSHNTRTGGDWTAEPPSAIPNIPNFPIAKLIAYLVATQFSLSAVICELWLSPLLHHPILPHINDRSELSCSRSGTSVVLGIEELFGDKG
jgi:hypothetical protein